MHATSFIRRPPHILLRLILLTRKHPEHPACPLAAGSKLQYIHTPRAFLLRRMAAMRYTALLLHSRHATDRPLEVIDHFLDPVNVWDQLCGRRVDALDNLVGAEPLVAFTASAPAPNSSPGLRCS